MGSSSHRDPGDRKAILRDVYEDNVRTTRDKYRRAKRRRVPESDQMPSTRRPSRSTASLVVGILLVLATALTAKHVDTDPAAAVAADSADVPMNLAASQPAMLTGPSPIGGPSANADAPSVAELYGLHLETIVIDAGHGGDDPGAIGRQGLQEKDVTLDVALRLKKRLEAYPGYRILLTREGESSMELRDRIEYANNNAADLFISLHVNWLPVDSIAPIETYFYGPNSDGRALRLAQRENRNSGYSLAEFNDLTQRLSVDLKIQESREAAHSIQEGLVQGLRGMGRDVSDWGAKSGDFMVLLGVEAPSILAEIGSLSNQEEEEKLLTVSYREKLAYILEQGISNYLGLHEHANAQVKNGSQTVKEGV